MDPQTRRVRYEHRKRVNIKRNYRTKRGEDERIPFQCREKMAVKELDAASRHSTRNARQAGEVVKSAARPRQANCQPRGCEGER